MLDLGYLFCKAAAQPAGVQTSLLHGVMLSLVQGLAFACAVDEAYFDSFPQCEGSPPCNIVPELQLGIVQELPVSAICLIIRG